MNSRKCESPPAPAAAEAEPSSVKVAAETNRDS